MSKVVGVIGGMGPAATVEYLARLVRATPAKRDSDHLRVLVDSDPTIPSRTDAILHGGPDPAPRLRAIARGLEHAAAEVLAMPCNTAQAYLESVREAVSIPVLDMLAETADHVNVGCVGLLATEAAIRTGLYLRALGSRRITVVVPRAADQAEVACLIAAVKAGRALEELRERLHRVTAHLRDEGASGLLVGCTEISLLHDEGETLPVVDALDCLVEATVREARAGGA
ncbi:MAG: amino acid racemase [bacterium]